MEPVTAVNFASPSTSRQSVGWQTQLRVDYAVNRVMQTHRGESAAEIAQAIQDQLRGVGVVPNGRMIQQYALVISQLPLLPPKTD